MYALIDENARSDILVQAVQSLEYLRVDTLSVLRPYYYCDQLK